MTVDDRVEAFIETVERNGPHLHAQRVAEHGEATTDVAVKLSQGAWLDRRLVPNGWRLDSANFRDEAPWLWFRYVGETENSGQSGVE